MPFSLSHVELYVSDLPSARPFWAWLFDHMGYEQCSEWSDGVCFSKDGHYFCFVQAPPGHRDQPHHRCRPGLNHLAFRADTPEEITALREALIERNVTLLYEDRYPHASSPDTHGVFFEGPERFKVEVVAPVTGETRG